MTRAEELYPSDETVPQDHGTMISSDTVLLGRSVFHGSFPESQVPFAWQAGDSGTGPLETTPISLIKLKEMAQTMLERNSTLRMLILSEPDYVPKATVLAKIEIFLRLLHKEMEG